MPTWISFSQISGMSGASNALCVDEQIVPQRLLPINVILGKQTPSSLRLKPETASGFLSLNWITIH